VRFRYVRHIEAGNEAVQGGIGQRVCAALMVALQERRVSRLDIHEADTGTVANKQCDERVASDAGDIRRVPSLVLPIAVTHMYM